MGSGRVQTEGESDMRTCKQPCKLLAYGLETWSAKITQIVTRRYWVKKTDRSKASTGHVARVLDAVKGYCKRRAAKSSRSRQLSGYVQGQDGDAGRVRQDVGNRGGASRSAPSGRVHAEGGSMQVGHQQGGTEQACHDVGQVGGRDVTLTISTPIAPQAKTGEIYEIRVYRHFFPAKFTGGRLCPA